MANPLLLAAALLAADLDGSIAEPGRWTHARGPASCCGRTRDSGPDSFGGVRWTFRPKGTILAPPVTWDGALFLLHGAGKEATLQALDVEDGRPIASAAIPMPPNPAPAAWNRSLLLPEGKRLSEYRLQGARFLRRWSFEAEGELSAPRVHEGEVYVASPGALLRLRIGAKEPVWSAAGAFVGDPALLGDHVYALEKRAGKTLLTARRRADGAPAGECVVEDSELRSGEIAAAEGIVAVRLAASWALVARSESAGQVSLALDRTEKLGAAPIVNRVFALCVTGEREVRILAVKEPKMRPVITKESRPDLLSGLNAPTSASGVISFGPFAMEFDAMGIVWSVAERREGAAWKGGFRFGVVPSNGLALAVGADGTSLVAIQSEGFGS